MIGSSGGQWSVGGQSWSVGAVMAASSVSRAWPSNWFVAIDWLLHVFRSLLPATFLKAFSTCGKSAAAYN